VNGPRLKRLTRRIENNRNVFLVRLCFVAVKDFFEVLMLNIVFLAGFCAVQRLRRGRQYLTVGVLDLLVVAVCRPTDRFDSRSARPRDALNRKK
jgi:hypothetical protein